MPKVLVIGLDGATLNLVKPWAKQNILPTLHRIMEDGIYGKLQSVTPTISAAAWPSFMTGMNPGKTGAYDFLRREPNSYQLKFTSRDLIHGNSFWKILGQQGHKVCIMNVPMTYPPEEVNGILVSGLGTPAKKPFTNPIELSHLLNNRGYKVNKKTSFIPGNEKAFLDEVYDITEKQFHSALWLMQEYDWDFFMTVFYETDQLSAYFWRYMDKTHPSHNPATDLPYKHAIRDYYQKLDTYICKFIEKVGSDCNIIIMSDHGSGPLYRQVFLNEWLCKKGYLAIREHKDLQLRSHRKIANLGLTRRNLSTILDKYNLGTIENWMKDLLGKYVNILPRDLYAEYPFAIEWENTRAYSHGYQGQIYINLKGREPMGIVSDGNEYDATCQEIIADLLELRDPNDNQPIVDKAYLREEIYSGPNIDLAPDITLVMRDLSYTTHLGYEFNPKTREVVCDTKNFESGGHRKDGILLASGPNFRQSKYQYNPASILDLAPTILHLMNCPIPKEMDGHILSEWILSNLSPTYTGIDMDTHYRSKKNVPALTEEEEIEMIELLRKLGYLN